jgi:LmbE family N-acetylglucosaminyl deacetylase
MAQVLVVAAHPDDEVLGCGGAIARRAAMGDEITIVLLAEGAMSRAGKGDKTSYRREVKKLRRNSQKAAAILGAKQVVHFDFPDNRMDGVDFLDIVKTVEECLERYRPEVLYTHHVGDLNVDHTLVAKAVLTAARPLPRSLVSEIYSFGSCPLRSGVWGMGASIFIPPISWRSAPSWTKSFRPCRPMKPRSAIFPTRDLSKRFRPWPPGEEVRQDSRRLKASWF